MFHRMIGIALCCLGLAAAGRADEVNCASAQLSPDVLAVAPDLRALCVAVAQIDGKTFAIVDAEVYRAWTNNALGVRFRLPTGQLTTPRSFSMAPESHVRVGSRDVLVRDLSPGEQIAMFIDIERPEIALEPPAADQPLVLQPLQAPPTYARSAPSGVLLIGIGALLLGAGVAIVRIRRSQS